MQSITRISIKVAVAVVLFGVWLISAPADNLRADDPIPRVPSYQGNLPRIPTSFEFTKHPKFSSNIALLVGASENVPRGLPKTSANILDTQPAIESYVTSGLSLPRLSTTTPIHS
jgi:hypothetical protein